MQSIKPSCRFIKKPVMRIIGIVACIAMLASSAPATAWAENNSPGVTGNLLQRFFGDGQSQPSTKASPQANSKTTDQASQSRARRVPFSQSEIELSFAPLVDEVAGSVVNVYVVRQAQQRRSPFDGDPFFERFFGLGRQADKEPQYSLGSGVVVRANGLIITNFHVIKDAKDVKVALHDGREFECDIVLKDEQSDLAALKIRQKVNLSPIAIGKSDHMKVGDLVLAIGNPFGVGQTVTSGIVSAVARTRQGINDFGFFIQTDASINPGNSGGALVNMQGELIGINSAIYSRDGGSNGIGFAIPSDMAQVIINAAEQGNELVRPWLGASFQDVTPEIAESIGLERPRGALVVDVFPKGPAQQGGIFAGDVVLSVNGNDLENMDALGYRLATAGIGSQVRLGVFSKGQKKETTVKLEKPPETTPREEIAMVDPSPLAGAIIANLSPAIAQAIGVSASLTGVVIAKVDPESPAAENGFLPGDIIRVINGQEMTDTRIVAKLFADPGARWQIEIARGTESLVLARNGNMFRQFRR